jgi:hypothetical protein
VPRLELAPDLVEEAVFLSTSIAAERGDDRALAWLEQRERLYEISQSSERESAFGFHALERFRVLHMEDPLRMALDACPAAAGLESLFVRRARRTREEFAELYRAPDGAVRAVLPLRAERFLDLERLFDFALLELLYVDDMLDPGFAYAPELLEDLPLDPGRRDVVRERVSRAWKQRVEERARGGRPTGRFEELVDAAARQLSVG